MLITGERHLRLVLSEYVDQIQRPPAAPDAAPATRAPDVPIQPQPRRICAFSGGISSAASSTNTPRSHEVIQYSTPTGPVRVTGSAGGFSGEHRRVGPLAPARRLLQSRMQLRRVADAYRQDL
jgi:hypothetical protein